MFNKKTAGRKSSPKNQQPQGESKELKEKERHNSSSGKPCCCKQSTSFSNPEKHIHFEANRRTSQGNDKLEASCSFSRDTYIDNNSKQENLTGVTIKDVGLDIAGFLIEEEIKHNKEKLKLEIMKQITLSKELDKHLERQRYIMNNYICNNALKEAQDVNDFIDLCNCQECRKATMDILSTTTSKCVGKSSFSEKSLQVNRTDSVSNKTTPKFKNSFTQSTKDVSCQGNNISDMCKECNLPNENVQTKGRRSSTNVQFNCTPLQSVVSTIVELSPPLIEEYSTIKPTSKVNYCGVTAEPVTDVSAEPITDVSAEPITDVSAEPLTDVSDGPVTDISAKPITNPALVKKLSTVPVKKGSSEIQKPIEFNKQEAVITERTDRTLENINNLLHRPLNTIEPQTKCQQNSQEDATEMILGNIKNIIRDYMDSMNLNCNKCHLEPSTNREEKNSTKLSNSMEFDRTSRVPVKKSNMSTKCENDGTHIDIIMQFCESNKKKKAILEIQPCFDEKRCMKYSKKKCLKRKVSENMDTQCNLSSCSISNTSRKFSPYPLKDRTSFRKSSKPNIVCRKRENFCKQKKCPGMKTQRKTSNFSTASCPSNNSVEIIKVNRCNRMSNESESSSSDTTDVILKNRKICRSKQACSKKKHHQKKCLKFFRKKSTICTYAPNLVSFSNEQSKESRRNSREHTLTPRYIYPVRKAEHKSTRKLNHRSHKSKIDYSLSPFLETTRKDIKRGTTAASLCSLKSSNLDETSYREIQKYDRSKSRKTSNTCTTISLNLEGSNLDILEECFAKKKNDIKLYNPISEQWSINRFEGNDEILTSSNESTLLNKTRKQRLIKSVKGSKNVAFDDRCILHACSPDPSTDKTEIIQKHINISKIGIRMHPEEAEFDSSANETMPIENIKTYTKIIPEGGVAVSPQLETKIQLIQNWLSYIHNLKAKDKAISSAMVAFHLPTSSNYVLSNENSNQQLENKFTPAAALSDQLSEKRVTNKLKGSVFEKFKTNHTAEKFIDFSKWAIFKRGKKEIPLDPIKRTTIKQSNKNNELDCNKSKSEVFYSDSSSSSEYNIIGSSISDSSFETTFESILDVNENNHDELIQELICPNRNNFKRKYFDISETDKIINRAFYIQDIFVKLASTEEEKEYWRDTVLRAMKNIVTKTA